MRRKTVLLAGLLFGLIVIGPRAFAHNLITSETVPSTSAGAITIDDPSISRVYYSRLDLARPQTWFRFEAKKGDKVYLSVGVPKIERLRGFRPFSALVGPGLPPAELPFDSPPGLGAEVLAQAAPREFHEGVTGTDSWIVMEQTVAIPEAGIYYFVAYPANPAESRDRLENKLWMAIGTKERFGLKDLCKLGTIKRFVRDFHEVK